MLEFAIDLVRALFKAIKIILLFSIAVMLSACGKSEVEVQLERAHKENVELAQKLLDSAKNGPKKSTWQPPTINSSPQAEGDKK